MSAKEKVYYRVCMVGEEGGVIHYLDYSGMFAAGEMYARPFSSMRRALAALVSWGRAHRSGSRDSPTFFLQRVTERVTTTTEVEELR